MVDRLQAWQPRPWWSRWRSTIRSGARVVPAGDLAALGARPRVQRASTGHFLVWASTYGAGGRHPVWWWKRRAERLGASPAPPGAGGDVVLPDSTLAWIDGGPQGGLTAAGVAAPGRPRRVGRRRAPTGPAPGGRGGRPGSTWRPTSGPVFPRRGAG